MLEHPPITHKNMHHTWFVFYFLNTISSCWLPSGALRVLENPLVCVRASLSAILLPFPLHPDFFLSHLRLLLHVAPLGVNTFKSVSSTSAQISSAGATPPWHLLHSHHAQNPPIYQPLGFRITRSQKPTAFL